MTTIPSAGDAIVENALPTAAALVCAVEDHDRKAVDQLLSSLTRSQLYGLTVVLAAHVDPERPFIANSRDPDLAIRVISTAAAQRFGLNVHRIASRDRTRPALDARAVVCYAAHLTGMSSVLIGRHLNRDHTTILHAIGRAGADPRLRRIATALAAPHAPALTDEEDLAS